MSEFHNVLYESQVSLKKLPSNYIDCIGFV